MNEILAKIEDFLKHTPDQELAIANLKIAIECTKLEEDLKDMVETFRFIFQGDSK